MTIAFSTDGRAPALAGLLREALDAWLPGDLDDVDGGRRRGAPRVEAKTVCRWKSGARMLLETLNRLYESEIPTPSPNSQRDVMGIWELEVGRWE